MKLSSRGHVGVSVALVFSAFVSIFYGLHTKDSVSFNTWENPMAINVQTIQDASALFPRTTQAIEQLIHRALEDAQQRIETILNVSGQRTYVNTVKPLDELFGLSDIAIAESLLQLLEMVSPDGAIRKAAHDGVLTLQEFSIDSINNNVELYRALQEYVATSWQELTDEQNYFVTETLKSYKRAGLDLAEAVLEEVRTLKKELAALTSEFEKNISEDATTVCVDRAGLTGLAYDFIKALSVKEDGQYELTLDYPTYFAVMDNCCVAATRKKLYLAFQNRAYPVNEAILKAIIKKRDQLAKKLGFASYAELDLDSQMVKTPQTAQAFLDELVTKIEQKAEQEFCELTNELPESVILSANNKLWPWDSAYVMNQYKKRQYTIDEDQIAEYFPMEATIKGLLAIYSQFLSLDFKEVFVNNMWHEDVTCVSISHKGSDKVLGYIFLDLYPRANKFSHACHGCIVPATFSDGAPTKGISIVIANFQKATADKPPLLKRSEVQTFFHEFGHAIHSRLGRTELASFAGTCVKTDFVEMPSQMLEEWLTDFAIIKQLSAHYQTGESLSDEQIRNILRAKNFGQASWVTRQAWLARLSLNLFLEGEDTDPHATMLAVQKIDKHTEGSKESHMYNSFGHLGGYGAKYYGYLWSKVFALDLFETIKEHGLLNSDIGCKYVDLVIGKGGSKDPSDLLQDFLGRSPTQDAFLRDIGVSV
jgi:thimet oligopeptidase